MRLMIVNEIVGYLHSLIHDTRRLKCYLLRVRLSSSFLRVPILSVIR